jgi:hypothetical protein
VVTVTVRVSPAARPGRWYTELQVEFQVVPGPGPVTVTVKSNINLNPEKLLFIIISLMKKVFE